jgi:branched-chain amino acid transport system substrate-binding protein
MLKMKLFLVVVLILSLLSVPLLSGCSDEAEETPTPTKAATPVKTQEPTQPPGETKILNIGVIAPLTGPVKFLYDTQVKGIDLQVAEINDRGGLKVGNDRYLVNIIWEDQAWDVDKAVAAAEKLIYIDKVKFIIGPWGGPLATATYSIFEENKVANFILGMSTEALTPNTKYVFRTTADDAATKGVWARWLADMEGVDTVTAVFFNDDVGRTNAEHFQAGVEPGELDITVEYIDPNATDYYPLLTKILAADRDAMITYIAEAGSVLFYKQLGEMGGYDGVQACMTPISITALAEGAGVDAIEGLYISGTDWYSEKTPEGLRELNEAWVQAYGEELSSTALYCIDTLPLFAMAIEDADSVDPTEVVETMESWDTFETYWGTSTWGGQEMYGIAHVLNTDTFISQIVNGKAELVHVVPIMHK